MSKEPQTYAFSKSEVTIQALLSVLGVAVMAGVTWYAKEYLPLAVAAAVGSIFAVWRSSRLKTVIAEDGISTQGVFGEKSLRWNEISRVSGRYNEIKLHNLDGDVTLAPSTELAGYEEVIEQIGAKRPDLFDMAKHPIIKKSAEYAVILPLVALFSIVVGVFIWSQADEFGVLPFAVFFVIGLAVLGFSFSAPQIAQIKGDSLRVKYLWGEKTFSAAEIQSVELAYQQVKSSKNYLVRLNLSNGNPLKLFGLAPSMPVIYLVLKNWHGKSHGVG
jgi:hypothetical protein